MQTVKDVRNKLIEKYKNKEFIKDKTGVKTIELIGESFLADEDWIIRKPNYDYIQRELDWYESESLFVDDIPGKTPEIWKQVSDNDGKINSNYGYLVRSKENGEQYKNVLYELEGNSNSRRAVMIYNRPSMHVDYNRNGMSDFVCTYANTFYIRNGKLISHYLMRSNDSVFGYTADVHWAMYIQKMLAGDLNIEVGDIIWTASNLHVYERHFSYIEELMNNE